MFYKYLFYLKQILFSFYYLFSQLFAGAPVGEALSGPVGIAVMTGKVAKLGFNYLLNFMALLSLTERARLLFGTACRALLANPLRFTNAFLTF